MAAVEGPGGNAGGGGLFEAALGELNINLGFRLKGLNEVMRGLKELDQVAYVRFASVYRSFQDIHEFMNALSTLLKNPP